MSDAEPTFCECEYCPGHHDAGPMPTIYCQICKKVIPTGPNCDTYHLYGNNSPNHDFRCGKCHKNTQAKERRAKKKAK